MHTDNAVPTLIGTRGWVQGERYILKDGESVVIGRSRSCDISLRRIPGYLERPPGERDADRDFNTVSRQHLRLSIANGTARLEDLSTNGSYCNDRLLSAPIDVDLRRGGIEIRLGTREVFRLELLVPRRADPSSQAARSSQHAAVQRPPAPHPSSSSSSSAAAESPREEPEAEPKAASDSRSGQSTGG